MIYIATDWKHHFPVAKCAMENGKHAAIEVPSAMNLEQCWDLIDLSEKNVSIASSLKTAATMTMK